MDVAIIGTGHNGLITAYYLAKQGLDVHLFEKRDFTGGATLTEELWPGYKFSTCAHLLHLFHPRILNDLDLVKRGLEVLPRSKKNLHMKSHNTYWGLPEDNSPRNLLSNSNLSKEERKSIEKYETFKATLRKASSPYRLKLPPTMDQIRADLGSDQLVLDQAMNSTMKDLRDHFFPSQLLKDFYADEAAPVNRNPSALFLAYASMASPDDETGELPANGYVKGGLGALAAILTEAAIEAGATVHTGKAVEKIMVEGKKAVGIRLEDGTEIRSRIVVSNLDPKTTFLKILPEDSVDPDIKQRIGALRTNVSCYKLLAAVSELPQWEAWDGDPIEPSRGGVRLNVSEAEISASYDSLEAG
ncbi:MAG: NAD(P)/FAD-dependent oxidoreductase [Opitutaceae bacterium]|nr:NAD(P)/FAD-dependent oxidoreductase [Opitutaceae bacterium]